MLAVQPEAFAVFIGHLREHVGPQVARFLPLAPGPGGGAEVFGGPLARHVAHQLDPQHHGKAIAPGLDLGGGGKQRDAARGAGGLVAAGGHTGKVGVDVAEEAAQLALPGKQFGDEIADVGHFHLGGLDPCRGEGLFGHVAEQVEYAAALALDIAGKIALRPAQDKDFSRHRFPPQQAWPAPFRAPCRA